MKPNHKKIQVSHRYRASAERVFDAFLDPDKAGKFLFATPTGQMMQVLIEPRVGGQLLFVERRDGEDVAHSGRYLALERPGRLVFEFTVPKYSPDTTRVQIEIVADGEGCLLTLAQELPGEAAERSQHGWQTVLANLARLVEKGA